MSAPSASCSASTPILHALTLVDPWYGHTASGAKRFEGRLYRSPELPALQAGDVFLITHASDPSQPALHRRVRSVQRFRSFKDGLGQLPLSDTLPGVASIEEGVRVYGGFYSEQAQEERGACFIETEALPPEEQARIDRLPRQGSDEFTVVVAERTRAREQWEREWMEAHGSEQERASAAVRQQVEAYVQQRLDQLYQPMSAREAARAVNDASAASASPAAAPAPAAAARPSHGYLSLWLQPAPDSDVASKLSSCVEALSRQHGQDPFVPHVTLVSIPWTSESQIRPQDVLDGVGRAVEAVLGPEGQRNHSIPCRVEAVSTHPKRPYTTLVLMLERSPALLALRTAIWEHVVTPCSRTSAGVDLPAFPAAPFPFMPHLSLLYDTRRQLSGAQRERLVETQIAWGGKEGRAAFSGLSFDGGLISLVDTSAARYADWRVLGTVALSTGLPPLQSPPVALPADAVPLCPSRDAQKFRTQVVDPSDHALYLRVCDELAQQQQQQQSQSQAGAATASSSSPSLSPSHGSGSVLVCDGQVVLSASGTSSEQQHSSASLLRRAHHLATAEGVEFFSPGRLERMQLYCTHEPCAPCLEAISRAGVRTVLFGRSSRCDGSGSGSGQQVQDAAGETSSAQQPRVDLTVLGPLVEVGAETATEAQSQTKAQAPPVASS